ncbi:MAG: DUF29 domain-containing protein [Alphaproteobacteria bacterium]|nr:DUF29 domain-containing protein [Alphaproteobacteria bacterium]
MPKSGLYERDFYAWANEQAALLRSGQLSTADIEHIAEEIESMGKTEKRELASRLTVLLTHLLKWQFQPERRGRSWRSTITIQRHALADHLADNPSLKSTLDQVLTRAYEDGRLGAIGETDLPESLFPSECPWSFERIMDAAFWPDHH